MLYCMVIYAHTRVAFSRLINIWLIFYLFTNILHEYMPTRDANLVRKVKSASHSFLIYYHEYYYAVELEYACALTRPFYVFIYTVSFLPPKTRRNTALPATRIRKKIWKIQRFGLKRKKACAMKVFLNFGPRKNPCTVKLSFEETWREGPEPCDEVIEQRGAHSDT